MAVIVLCGGVLKRGEETVDLLDVEVDVPCAWLLWKVGVRGQRLSPDVTSR